MSRIQATIGRIHKALSLHGITMKDLISEYAPLKSEVIKPNTLQRALLSCQINLSPIEFQDLILEFQAEENVSISAIINAVDNFVSQPLILNDHSDCYTELIALSHDLNVAHQTVREIIRPYDRQNRGIIKEDIFYKAFGISPRITKIVKSFSNPQTNEINYLEIDPIITEALNQNKPDLKSKTKPEAVDIAIKQFIDKEVDVYNHFKSQDRHHNGKLPPNSFEMLLTTCGIKLTQSQMRDISRYYTNEENLVDYLSLVNDIKAVLHVNAQSPKKKPEIQVVDADKVVAYLRSKFIERRIDPHQLFMYMNTNSISKYAFFRVIHSTKIPIPPSELEIVANKFELNGNDIDFKKFVAAVTLNPEIKPLADVLQTFDKVKSHLSINNLSLKPMMLKYDRHNSGQISTIQFLFALQQSGIQIDSYELQEIEHTYPGNQKDYINWKPIVDIVDPVQPIQPKVQEELIQVNQKTEAKIEIEEPPAHIMITIEKIADMTRQWQMNLIDDFRARDRLKHGTVIRSQFFAVMSPFCARFSERDLNSLYQHFSKNGDFEYISFDKYLNNNKQSNSITKANESNEFKYAIRRCKAMVMNKMTTIEDLFMPFDHQRNGAVDINIVITVFARASIKLETAEINQLISVFTDELNPERFKYRLLGRRIQQENMSKEEASKLVNPVIAQEEMLRELKSTQTEIKGKLNARRKNIFSLFTQVSSELSQDQFFNVLSNSGIVLLPKQIKAICQFYTIPYKNSIDWRSFCNDVDKSKLI